MRLGTLAVLTSLIAVSACKPKVAPEWEATVPTEGLYKAIPLAGDPSAGTPEGMTLFYERKSVTAAQVAAGFKAKITAQGYDHISECPGNADEPGDSYAKAPMAFLDVSMRPVTEDHWSVKLQRSDKIVKIGLPAGCKWLPAAAKYCGGMPSGDECAIAVQAK